MPPQPIEIPWTLIGTTRLQTPEGLAELPAAGCTLAVYNWEPPPGEHTPKGKRLVYYKFTVSLAPRVKNFLGRLNQHYEALFAGLFQELRIAVLQVRLTAGKGMAYFANASPRERTVTERADGSMQVTTGGSSSISVGKSHDTLHDQTTTGVQTVTDPGTEWGVDLGFFSVGGSGDTTQNTTTTVTRNASNSVDMTQRDASTERAELFSFTSRLANTLSLLTCNHLGSPDLRFTLWAPPVQAMPDIGPGGLAQRYLQTMRRRSSGREGGQEFMAVAVVDEDARVCVETRLDTVYFSEIGKPTSNLPVSTGAVSALEEKKIREYLEHKYPPGFPVDDLDVDVLELSDLSPEQRETYRNACILGWAIFTDKRTVGLMGECFFANQLSPNHDVGRSTFWAMYKPLTAVSLEALRYHREIDYVTKPFTFPVVQTLSLKVCDKEAPKTSEIFHIAPLEDLVGGMSPGDMAGAATGNFEMMVADAVAAKPISAMTPASLRDPTLQAAVLDAAAEAPIEINIDAALDLGLAPHVVEMARGAGATTLAGLARMAGEEDARDDLSGRPQPESPRGKGQRPRPEPRPADRLLPREVVDILARRRLRRRGR